VVRAWEDIQQESQAIRIPRVLDQPLPVLPCHTNGMICQWDPTRCQYVTASMESMRKHWRTTH
jgi:hypothetical protein